MLCCVPLHAQYNLRGKIIDEENKPVFRATLRLHSKNNIYYFGSVGTLGIETAKAADTLTVSKDEYDTTTLAVNATQFQQVRLNSVFGKINVPQNLC